MRHAGLHACDEDGGVGLKVRRSGVARRRRLVPISSGSSTPRRYPRRLLRPLGAEATVLYRGSRCILYNTYFYVYLYLFVLCIVQPCQYLIFSKP